MLDEIINMENEIYLKVMENTLKKYLTDNLNLEVDIFKSLKDNTINIYSEVDISLQLNASINVFNQLFDEKINEFKDIFTSGRVGYFKLTDMDIGEFNSYVLTLNF